MPEVIAHRGASYDALENTQTSVLLGLEQNADGVEFDVRFTKDEVVVLLHDETLKRTFGIDRSIDEILSIDLPSLMESHEDRLITMEEALNLTKTVTSYVERKTGSAIGVYDVISDTNAVSRSVVIAFDWEFLSELKSLDESIQISALGKGVLSDQLEEIVEATNPEWVGWKQQDIDKESIAEAHARGIKVNLWTVDEPEDAIRFTEWRVDSITTNRPGFIREILEKEFGKSAT